MKERKVEKQKKHNYKFILGIIVGGVVFGTIGTIAATQIASANVTYTNNSQSTVQGALNNLFDKTNGMTRYAFGDPTDSSVTSYLDYNKLLETTNVFIAAKGTDKYVCLYRDNALACFDITAGLTNFKNSIFKDVGTYGVGSTSYCYSTGAPGYNVNFCIISDFGCYHKNYTSGDIYSEVYCTDENTKKKCTISTKGTATCEVTS